MPKPPPQPQVVESLPDAFCEAVFQMGEWLHFQPSVSTFSEAQKLNDFSLNQYNLALGVCVKNPRN
jgi:hypothetical protein